MTVPSGLISASFAADQESNLGRSMRYLLDPD